ncbi:hypothetical protein [Microtetraspora malaysiensis]|uniref:hypothetical protein n=1 Tax=Microtetraspora malaysiensis TaxID=161358 RepID=UPI00157BE08C|nr:hypothetical protein [Microtetraspora malaysiensis]
MAGYHTRRTRSEFEAEDPERIAIREALAFGKALYDRRMALGLIDVVRSPRGMSCDARVTPR